MYLLKMNALIVYYATLFSIATCKSIISRTNQGCRNKVTTIDGKRFELFQKLLTYDDATQFCKNWGNKHRGVGSLAYVKTSKIQHCLTEMIGTFNPSKAEVDGMTLDGYFVGGSDRNEEGVWKWGDGELIPLKEQKGYQNWGILEPNNMYDEDCIVMMPPNGFGIYPAGTWIDHICGQKNYFICQLDIPKQSVKKRSPRISSDKLKKQLQNQNCGQSPARLVDIDINVKQLCQNKMTVTGWGSEVKKVQWDLMNTGNEIKITVNPPNSMYTRLGKDTDIFVDHMVLKWNQGFRDGSDHMISGVGYTGELQIFHRSNNNLTNVIVFLLQSRTFSDNRGWNELIRYTALVQNIGMEATMPAPVDFLTKLIKDTAMNSYHRSFRFITSVALRYRESSCGNDVTWTVYPRPILLSFSQFTRLRHLRQYPKSRANLKPIKYQKEEMCIVGR